MEYKTKNGRIVHLYRNGENIHQMFKEYPFCHWCGRETKIIRKIIDEVKKLIFLLPEEATRDHIFHRELHADLRKKDQKRNGGRSTVILACKRCNSRRGRQHQLQYVRSLSLADRHRGSNANHVGSTPAESTV